ncbi:MAG: hypothetical protein MHPSP_002762, partial [Paramarteilia canceri]
VSSVEAKKSGNYNLSFDDWNKMKKNQIMYEKEREKRLLEKQKNLNEENQRLRSFRAEENYNIWLSEKLSQYDMRATQKTVNFANSSDGKKAESKPWRP